MYAKQTTGEKGEQTELGEISAAHMSAIMRQLTNPNEEPKPASQIESGMKEMSLEEKKQWYVITKFRMK